MGEAKNKVKLFEEKQVRAVWDEEAEKWWFSILDIIGILTEQSDYDKTRNYWKWLKNKLKDEGSEVVSNANQLKLLAPYPVRAKQEGRTVQAVACQKYLS